MPTKYKDLDAYKLSINLVVDIYKITLKFPGQEKFGLCSQMRRAAASIPSNIAEGASRQGNKEYIHFLYIAMGSKSELETQLLIACKIGYISNEEFNYLDAKITESGRLLGGLIRYRKTLTP